MTCAYREVRGLRGAAQRIGHQENHRPHAAVAGREDLLGHRRRWDHAAHLRPAADPALPAADLDPLALRQPRGDRCGGRAEHHTAGAVEVAGEDVDEVASPTRQRAELLHARAEASVASGRRRGGELARQAADHVGVDSAVRGHHLWRKLARQCLDRAEPADQAGRGAEIDQVLGEQGMDQCEQKRRVGGGSDEMVLTGQLGRLGAAWVDHHDLAAASRHRLQAARGIGHGHEAAVRDHRVGADDEQIVRPIDVGHRHGGRKMSPEHQAGLHDLWQSVDRRRVEQAATGEGALQHGSVEQGAEVVHHRIAGVHADGVVAVLLANGEQSRRDLVVGLIPTDGVPAVRRAPHRLPQPVRIVIQLLEAVGLRADVAVREWIVLVAAHRENRVALDLDREAAGGFAEGTDARDGTAFGAVGLPRLSVDHWVPPAGACDSSGR